MPSYDFEVDLQALMNAAKGADDTVKAIKDYDVVDFLPSEDAVANDTVWDAVSEFENRWEQGANNLVEDIQEVSGRLAQVAGNYAQLEQEGYDALSPLKADISSLQLFVGMGDAGGGGGAPGGPGGPGGGSGAPGGGRGPAVV